MIQNELLYEVYREEIAMQVAETSFVSVQVDEPTVMYIPAGAYIKIHTTRHFLGSLWKLRIKPLWV